MRLVLRQRDVLKLAFWHAQILVNRQFLLKTFTSLANYEPRAGGPLAQRKEEVQKNVKTCIEAAEHIIEHIDRISAAGELYSTLFVGQRFKTRSHDTNILCHVVHPILWLQRCGHPLSIRYPRTK